MTILRLAAIISWVSASLLFMIHLVVPSDRLTEHTNRILTALEGLLALLGGILLAVDMSIIDARAACELLRLFACP